jgi:hypothetical protein
VTWAEGHRVRGILVRPDRFIAQRLDHCHDLRSLDPFAGVAGKPQLSRKSQPSNRRDSRMAAAL